ncbi:glycosyltransferase [Pelomicrobium sp.]|jgi:glycosyltransferase involved in cell wall biosynthesis|uniref:glycosyltransferase n=1 Tax=Pelomicrobium sp. TaxID=2815319 RepID=UPI002FDE5407
METDPAWPVMVLAHNEEEKIAACLDSVCAAEPGKALDIYVMANGCTDGTEDIVREYSCLHPEVHLVSIPLGDKCNAWNVFIHEIVPERCPGREVYFFMDGDARIRAGSLSALAGALQADSHAYAASAVPGSGRSMAKDRRDILEQRGLVANLYALRGTFVERLRQCGVRLPLKLEGDDGLLGALIKWNLEPRGEWDDRLIHPCPDAVFDFDPVPVGKLTEWPKYWRRLVRYGRRHFEFQLLGPRLRRMGLAGLPTDIQELYADADTLRLPWKGIYTLTHLVALRQMRRIGRMRQAARVPS